MTSTTPSAAPPHAAPDGRALGWFWPGPIGQTVLLIVWLASRYAFAARRQLVPDEAYYWVWSRHPALSYFDHPPFVAWMIRFGTALVGTNELGVRWPGFVLMAATVLMLAGAARRLLNDSPAAAFVPVALFLSPIVTTLGGIITPDTPACFFQAAALICVLTIFAPGKHRTQLLWIVFGLMMGLAMMSKYTSVLLGVSVLLALVWTPEGRKHLCTVWPWLAAMLAFAVFLPVIIWNADHQWASFRFQLHHGVADSGSRAIPHLFEFIGGQIAAWTPILFGVCMVAIFRAWTGADKSTYKRILMLTASVPLVFFALSSLRGRAELNWPIFAFFPAVLLVAHDLAAHFTSHRIFWAEFGVKIALVATLLIQFPEVVWSVNPKWGIGKWDDLFGWRELAAKVDEAKGDRTVFASDYEWTSELSFYMPGQPEIWPMSFLVRPSSFDYFPNPIKLDETQSVLVVTGMAPTSKPPTETGAFRDFHIVAELDFIKLVHGRNVRRGMLVLADHKNSAETQPTP